MSSREIRDAYAQSGVEAGRVVYVTGNFGRPGLFGFSKTDLLHTHLEVLLDLLGPSGTLCVPTASLSLIQSGAVFELDGTPSEMGPFTELVRRSPGSRRQNHPYVSQAGLGSLADFIVQGPTRHVFGPESPMDRMTRRETRFISVGSAVEQTMSIVHHVEFLANVPYRFIKTFQQSQRQPSGGVTKSTRYLHVVYRDKRLKRNHNQRIGKALRAEKHVKGVPLGRSFIESYEFTDFMHLVLPLMLEDPYIWLDRKVLPPYEGMN